MSEPVTTIVAVIGSVVVVLISYNLTQLNEKRQRRRILVQRYLFQLQDALATLWYRLGNLAFDGGKTIMENKSDDYYMSTTLETLYNQR